MSSIGHGSTLTIGGDAIGKITNISGPDFTKDLKDATSMESTGGYREWIAGLKDWGRFSFTTLAAVLASADTTNYYDTILTEAAASAAVEIVVTFPNGTTGTFDAHVESFRVNDPVDDLIQTEVTLKVDGPIVWANAA